MEKKQNVKSDNKGLVVIVGIVAIIAIIVIVLLIKNGKHGGEITANVGEAQWMDVDQTLRLIDGSNKITFNVFTNQDLIKVEDNYEYEVEYILTVNDVQYTGTHKFGNGYAVHNENNGIPYNIDMMDFDDNKIQVSFSPAQPITQ